VAKEKAASLRFVGDSAEQLASGRPLAPGDELDLTDEELDDPYNQYLIADGKIIGTNPTGESQVTAAKEKLTKSLSGESEASPEAATDDTKEG